MRKSKSVRLSIFLRDAILTSVMEEFTANCLKPLGFTTVEQLRGAIKDEGFAIARELWRRCYGGLEISRVPRWALNNSNQFTVAMEGDTSKTFASYVHLTADKRVSADRLPCKQAIDLLVSEEEWVALFDRKNMLEELKQKHQDEHTALRQEVKPVLDSFNTTKQLLETWPSMEKFLPANIADPDKGINLPAISLSRLEEKINGNS